MLALDRRTLRPAHAPPAGPAPTSKGEVAHVEKVCIDRSKGAQGAREK
jgi:hypothetical protein